MIRRSALGLGVALTVACGPGAEDGRSVAEGPHEAALQDAEFPPGVDAVLVRAGAAVYHGPGGCHVCHAPDGTGARGVGADLTDEVWWHSDGSWQAIVDQVKSGVDASVARNVWGASMPPRGGSAISDAQVEAVAAYVWSLRLIRPPEGPGEAGPGG